MDTLNEISGAFGDNKLLFILEKNIKANILDFCALGLSLFFYQVSPMMLSTSSAEEEETCATEVKISSADEPQQMQEQIY